MVPSSPFKTFQIWIVTLFLVGLNDIDTSISTEDYPYQKSGREPKHRHQTKPNTPKNSWLSIINSNGKRSTRSSRISNNHQSFSTKIIKCLWCFKLKYLMQLKIKRVLSLLIKFRSEHLRISEGETQTLEQHNWIQ